MDIIAFLDNFTSKQRLTVLGALGVMAVGLMQYPNPPQAAVAPNQVEKQLDVADIQGVLPKGYSTHTVIRDPFAMPAQYAPQPAGAVYTGSGRDRISEKARESLPVVQGIVGAGSTKVAIMAIGSDSRSYRVRERIGSYVIASISNSSVTLQGPDGTIVVPLGR